MALPRCGRCLAAAAAAAHGRKEKTPAPRKMALDEISTLKKERHAAVGHMIWNSSFRLDAT